MNTVSDMTVPPNYIKSVDVSIGIIKNETTREVLLAWRDAGKDQGNCYEFPGGKVEQGESPRDALARELYEEVGIAIVAASVKKITTLTYTYPKKTVVLHVFIIHEFSGKPRGLEGQAIRWVSVDELPQLDFPAANVPLIRMARLQPRYCITHDIGYFEQLDAWLIYYVSKLPMHAMCYVRDKSLNQVEYAALIQRLHQARPDLQLIAQAQHRDATEITSCVAGFHMSRAELLACEQLIRTHDSEIIVAACHDLQSIVKANNLGVDGITISSVNTTNTHPDIEPLGWEMFFELAGQANCPVYALGGISLEDTKHIAQTDVFGLAGIRNML